jgi:hypothetical protein
MSKHTKQIQLIALTASISVVTACTFLAYTFMGPVFSVDESNLPRFITHNILSPRDFASVSRFRSGSGTSVTSGGETCRNMSQIFTPPSQAGLLDTNIAPPATIPEEQATPVYSPLDGKIVALNSSSSGYGKLVIIQSREKRAYQLTIDGVYPEGNLKVGEILRAGQKIGGKLKAQSIRVEVMVTSLTEGNLLVPYTSLLTPELFSREFISRGAGDTSDFIITKQERDSKPLTCNPDGSFIMPNFGNVESGLRTRIQEDFVTLGDQL